MLYSLLYSLLCSLMYSVLYSLLYILVVQLFCTGCSLLYSLLYSIDVQYYWAVLDGKPHFSAGFALMNSLKGLLETKNSQLSKNCSLGLSPASVECRLKNLWLACQLDCLGAGIGTCFDGRTPRSQAAESPLHLAEHVSNRRAHTN